MIRLSADRLDVHGRFRFRIEGTGLAPAVTADADAAVAMLAGRGVADAGRLLAHVRQWGSVEIEDDAASAAGLER